MQLAELALQQHFGDTGRRTEVAVDLERRMGVEQVRIDSATAVLMRLVSQSGIVGKRHGIFQQQVRMVSVEQARPECDLPRPAPASTEIPACRKRAAGCIRIKRIERR